VSVVGSLGSDLANTAFNNATAVTVTGASISGNTWATIGSAVGASSANFLLPTLKTTATTGTIGNTSITNQAGNFIEQTIGSTAGSGVDHASIGTITVLGGGYTKIVVGDATTVGAISGSSMTSSNSVLVIDGSGVTTAALTITGGAGNDTLTGGAGNDSMVSSAGNDTYTPGSGTDTITFAGAGAGVTVVNALTTSTGVAGSATGTGTGTDVIAQDDAFEVIIGSGFADYIKGTDVVASTISGGAGNDTIGGGGSAESISGGDGADLLAGDIKTVAIAVAATPNSTNGGVINLNNTDFTVASTGTASQADVGNATVTALSTAAAKAAGILSASYASGSVTVVYAYNSGTDAVTTNTNSTFTLGTPTTATTSTDVFAGGAGNDTIHAGGGADTISGGEGNDTIVLTEASAAIDVIRFGSSVATNGTDTITGAGTTDLINLNAFAGSTGTVTAVTGNLTPTASAVYFLATTANATDANTAAAAATALSAGAVWAAPSAAVTAYIVINDTNSTSVYSWTDVAGSTDEVAAAELTLLGTIDAVIPSTGIGFGG